MWKQPAWLRFPRWPRRECYQHRADASAIQHGSAGRGPGGEGRSRLPGDLEATFAIGDPPLFEIVSVKGALAIPTCCAVKLNAGGDTPMPAAATLIR